MRTSVVRAASAALDELAITLPEPVVSMSLRAWSADFPKDIALQRRVPYESRADSVMYCQVLAELAPARRTSGVSDSCRADHWPESARAGGGDEGTSSHPFGEVPATALPRQSVVA